MIKAGSTIHHIPSDESWFILGINREKDKVCVVGYPPTIANLSDCVEIEEGNGITVEELEYRNKEFGMDWE